MKYLRDRARSGKRVWGHNAAFDSRILRASNIAPSLEWDDTLIMGRACFTQHGGMDLATLGNRVLGTARDKDVEVRNLITKHKRELRKKGIEINKRESYYDTVNPEIMGAYAAMDGLQTTGLSLVLPTIMQDQVRPAYELDRACIKPVVHMEEAGLHVDLDRAEKLRKSAQGTRYAYEGFLRKSLGVKNPNSWQQMLPAIQKLVRRYPNLAPENTAAATIRELYAHTGKKEFRWILLGKQARKIEQFGQQILDFATEKHYIHGNINIGRPITSRFSISDPPLQQQPKRDPWGVRGCFGPPPGYSWLLADFNQIEFLTFTARCQNEALLHKLNEGMKYHSIVCGMVFGVEHEDGPEYDMAKTTNFLSIYGGGVKQLVATLNAIAIQSRSRMFTFEEVNKFMRDYHYELPEVKQRFNEVERILEKDGFIETPFGRRFYANRDIYPYKYVNYDIQSIAADIMKVAMLRIFEELPQSQCRLLLSIHDEFILQVPTPLVNKYAPKVKEIMESLELPGELKQMKIRADVMVAHSNWKEKVAWQN